MDTKCRKELKSKEVCGKLAFYHWDLLDPLNHQISGLDAYLYRLRTPTCDRFPPV